MDYVIGAVLGFILFTVVYFVGALLTGVVVRLLTGSMAAYDRASGPALLVAVAAGGWAFYAYAIA